MRSKGILEAKNRKSPDIVDPIMIERLGTTRAKK
jgi:hypothetical protein